MSKKAYLVGAGLTSLATAVYLIQEGKLKGENIIIFEATDRIGGGLDATHLKSGAYFMRGFRMLEEKIYVAIQDLMSRIPSVENPQKTLKDEFVEFNRKAKTCCTARLMKKGKIINARPFEFNLRDQIAAILLLIRPESSFKKYVSIEEYFSPDFFQTNFWFEFSTVFSFEPWHSLIELRRYILRFYQDAPQMDTEECIRSTPYNQYDSLVLPIVTWLKKQGVNFQTNTVVSDIDFGSKGQKRRATSLQYVHKKQKKTIKLGQNDYLFTTLGSMVANSSVGSMHKAPIIKKGKAPAWELWEKIAQKQTDFGRPTIFDRHIRQTKWTSFTLTSQNHKFFDLIKNLTHREAGTEGTITIKDSNWVISFALPHQPVFAHQKPNQAICWGYGLYPDKKGNFIKKKMSECSGQEILEEICHHLHFNQELAEIVRNSECIPCFMPYITSHFMPRAKDDRPLIVPQGAENFAFLGQYCEIPREIVFTVEHSVRAAQIAVYKLLGINKKLTPIYKGQYNPKLMWSMLKTIFR